MLIKLSENVEYLGVRNFFFQRIMFALNESSSRREGRRRKWTKERETNNWACV